MPLTTTINGETCTVSLGSPRYEVFEALFDHEDITVHCPICEGTDTILGPPSQSGSVYCHDCDEIY